MATLTALLGDKFKTSALVAIISFEETNIVDSKGNVYFNAKLKDPVTVRCSSDNTIQSFEASEILVRASALELDGWQLRDPNNPQSGVFMPGWVVDFSKGQKSPIYQETTIQQWAAAERKNKNTELSDAIKKMIDEKYTKKPAAQQ